MSCCYAVVHRAFQHCGVLRDETWVNVVAEVRRSNQPWSYTLAKWDSVASDTNIYIVAIVERDYFRLVALADLYDDEDTAFPRLQQRDDTGHGTAAEFGTFSVRGNRGSPWVPRAADA